MLFLGRPKNSYPANTQRRRNVVTTSLQRHDVAATLLGRCLFAGYALVPCAHIFANVAEPDSNLQFLDQPSNALPTPLWGPAV